MRIGFIVGGLVVAVAVIVAISFWPQESTHPPPAVPEPTGPDVAEEDSVVAPPQPLPAPVAPDTPTVVEPEIELPALEKSDEFVREHIADWSLPLSWMQREDLLARAAVIMQNAAVGAVPRGQIAFAVPPEPYSVIKRGERYFVDQQGYRRYDGYLDILEAIPSSDAADFLRLVEPLLMHALAQLGERESPQQITLAAIQRIENLPQLAGEIELIRPNVVYIYADPSLEELAAFEKQILRMGPDNISRLSSYISEFKEYYFID